MRKAALISLFLFLSLTLIATVKAEPFDLMEIPAYLDTQLGVGEFVGGLLASIFALMMVILPVIVMTKGKAYTLYIILGLAVLAPLVALGWFPVWVYIIIILGIGFGAGKQIADFLGGLRK